VNNQNGQWEQLFLDAFSRSYLPSDKLSDIPEVVIVGLGILENNQKQLLKPLNKVKKVGQFYVGEYHGVPLAVVCQDMGALATEVTLRVLTKTRAKTVIGVGFVGGLQSSIEVGNIVLPTSAKRGEGTTKYYAPEEVAAVPSMAVQEALEKSLPPETHVHKGPVFTTAALIRESEEFISKLSSEGVFGIECEMSALFLISQMFGIQSGAILVVTDNPLLKRLWLDPGAEKEISRGLSQSITAAYNAAEALETQHGAPHSKSRLHF
jgi:uridine phosphorylase